MSNIHSTSPQSQDFAIRIPERLALHIWNLSTATAVTLPPNFDPDAAWRAVIDNLPQPAMVLSRPPASHPSDAPSFSW